LWLKLNEFNLDIEYDAKIKWIDPQIYLLTEENQSKKSKLTQFFPQWKPDVPDL
jgi:hypothetical protein